MGSWSDGLPQRHQVTRRSTGGSDDLSGRRPPVLNLIKRRASGGTVSAQRRPARLSAGAALSRERTHSASFHRWARSLVGHRHFTDNHRGVAIGGIFRPIVSLLATHVMPDLVEEDVTKRVVIVDGIPPATTINMPASVEGEPAVRSSC